MNERSFQTYFMKQCPHGYRTALVNGSGFPDVLMINGGYHCLVELKILEIGKSGNKKLASVFQKTQIPWYMNYKKKKGENLWVVFKLNKGYGVLFVTEEFCRDIPKLYYKDLVESDKYVFYLVKTVKEIMDLFFGEKI